MVDVKHIYSWSGGKDSTASIILAHENNEPIDIILFSEVMFDEYISGELPEHIDFIKNKAIPIFNTWGYKVEILRHNKTYMDYFDQVREKGKHVGMKVGFPMADRCNARNCKVKPIEKYLKQINEPYAQCVSIAADEPRRIKILTDTKYSLLVKYGYTEEMARQKCIEYDLLSPYYKYSKRGGCWFCPNQSICQSRYIRNNHNDLWQRLLALENRDNKIGNIFNSQSGKSIHEIDEQLKWEESQMSIFDFI